jgi:hypothetical protein
MPEEPEINQFSRRIRVGTWKIRVRKSEWKDPATRLESSQAIQSC